MGHIWPGFGPSGEYFILDFGGLTMFKKIVWYQLWFTVHSVIFQPYNFSVSLQKHYSSCRSWFEV
jgi:hypothetical protein